MLFRQSIFAIIMAVLLMLAIIELVRRRLLREEYSWLWLLTGASVIVVVAWYDALVWISRLIGAVLPTTTLFLVAIMFLMAISLHFSVKVSRLEDRIKELAQRHALLEATTTDPDPPEHAPPPTE